MSSSFATVFKQSCKFFALEGLPSTGEFSSSFLGCLVKKTPKWSSPAFINLVSVLKRRCLFLYVSRSLFGAGCGDPLFGRAFRRCRTAERLNGLTAGRLRLSSKVRRNVSRAGYFLRRHPRGRLMQARGRKESKVK